MIESAARPMVIDWEGFPCQEWPEYQHWAPMVCQRDHCHLYTSARDDGGVVFHVSPSHIEEQLLISQVSIDDAKCDIWGDQIRPWIEALHRHRHENDWPGYG